MGSYEGYKNKTEFYEKANLKLQTLRLPGFTLGIEFYYGIFWRSQDHSTSPEKWCHLLKHSYSMSELECEVYFLGDIDNIWS